MKRKYCHLSLEVLLLETESVVLKGSQGKSSTMAIKAKSVQVDPYDTGFDDPGFKEVTFE